MRVQLLYFDECPNVDRARAALRDAMAAEHVDLAVEEIDVESPDAPDFARGWGSPTILIDGADVTGADRSTGSACRLYKDGAPSIELIRGRLASLGRDAVRSNGAALPMLGAILAAFAASACCLLPALLALAGLSGAAFGAALAPYRVLLLAATGLALALGFWLVYRRPKDACGCPTTRSRRAVRVSLWITAAAAVALAGYPLLVGGYASAGSTEASAKATLRLKVSGMDCPACTGAIAGRLRKVPGVVSASVEYDSGLAIIRHDDRAGVTEAAIASVSDVGFSARVAP